MTISVCLSVANHSYVRLVPKLYQTNQLENLGECWYHDSRLPDAVL